MMNTVLHPIWGPELCGKVKQWLENAKSFCALVISQLTKVLDLKHALVLKPGSLHCSTLFTGNQATIARFGDSQTVDGEVGCIRKLAVDFLCRSIGANFDLLGERPDGSPYKVSVILTYHIMRVIQIRTPWLDSQRDRCHNFESGIR